MTNARVHPRKQCRQRRQRSWWNQRGAALVTALFVVLALLIIGLAAARTALNGEKSARSERDRHVAFQAAEAALSDAERDIEGGSDPASARAALFASDSTVGFVHGCGASNAANAGLCLYLAAPEVPAWQRAGLARPGAGNCVEYGHFTGARMPTGKGTLPARLPRYIIELMPLIRAGEDATKVQGNFYRITAIGFGARPSTLVVLQSFYLKVALAEGLS